MPGPQTDAGSAHYQTTFEMAAPVTQVLTKDAGWRLPDAI
jgi:hypothetical protein